MLLAPADARAREAAVADGDADPERQSGARVRAPEAGRPAGRGDHPSSGRGRPRRRGPPSARVVAGDADPIAGARASAGTPACARSGRRGSTRCGCPSAPMHADGPAHQRVDAAPAVRRGDERVAGHARVARVDAPVRGAGVPLVDRGVVLHAGIGAGPRRVGDLVPELLGGQRLRRRLPSVRRLSVHSPSSREHVEELVRHAHASCSSSGRRR